MINKFLIVIFIATFLEVFADILFKKWSVGGREFFLFFGVVLYMIGTIFWAYSLRFELLSKAISIFTVLNLILVILVGVVFFNENLSILNKIGILFGVISVILLEV
jgi:multidrug transporter EmrE-like cation transporter